MKAALLEAGASNLNNINITAWLHWDTTGNWANLTITREGRVPGAMNTRTASIITLALLLAPILAPLTATKAAAATADFTVSATRINYNIILVEITGLPHDKPPAVLVKLVTDGDESDYVPILVGYVGNNKWHAYIALEKALNVFDKGKLESNSNTVIYYGSADDPEEAKADNNGYFYSLYKLVNISLASPKPISPVYKKLGFAGKPLINITDADNQGTDIINGDEFRASWPIVAVFKDQYNGENVEKLVVTVEGTGKTYEIEVGASAAELLTTDTLNIAPEKTTEIKIKDTTLLVDPTTANKLTKTEDNPETVDKDDNNNAGNALPLFDFGNGATEAMKAAALEAGATALPVVKAFIDDKGNNLGCFLNLTVENLPDAATLYIKLETDKGTLYAIAQGGNVYGSLNITTEAGGCPDSVAVNAITVTIVPAEVHAYFDGQEKTWLYNGTVISTLQYAFITSLEESDGVLVAKLYMPGSNEIPPYSELQRELSVQTGTYVIMSFAEDSTAGGGQFDVNAVVNIQVGVVTLSAETVKPGQELTITLEDIDADSPTVIVAVEKKDGSRQALSQDLALDKVAEGKFSRTLKIDIADPGAEQIDSSINVTYVSKDVVKIIVCYNDKYPSTDEPQRAEASVEFWPLEVIVPEQAGKNDVVTLTIKSGNLNIKSDEKESIRVDKTNNKILYVRTPEDTVEVAKIWIEYKGQDKTSDVIVATTAYETAVDSGTYEIKLYLNRLEGLENGDTIKVAIRDEFSGEWINKTIEITAVEGTVKVVDSNDGTVSSIPVAYATGANVSIIYTIVVDDSDANTISTKKENATIFFNFIMQNGTAVSRNGDMPTDIAINISETGINTGVFEGTLNITYYDNGTVLIKIIGANDKEEALPLLEVEDIIYGKLVIKYNDTSIGKNVTIELPVKSPETAVLAIEPAIVDKLTDNVTITLYEPDLDVSSGEDRLPSD